MLHQKVKIVNKLGLHARAAMKLVNTADRFSSEARIVLGKKTTNIKNIMGVMTLAASKGTEPTLIVEGEDEEQAMAALVELINNKFGEDE